MYCPKCGKQNPEGSSYCSQCGTALVAVDSTPAVAAKPVRTSGMAIAALVLGCVGVVSGISSIPAIIFGAIAINQTGKDPSLKGRGMAIAGLVLGIVVLLFWLMIIALIIVGIVLSPELGGDVNSIVW